MHTRTCTMVNTIASSTTMSTNVTQLSPDQHSPVERLRATPARRPRLLGIRRCVNMPLHSHTIPLARAAMHCLLSPYACLVCHSCIHTHRHQFEWQMMEFACCLYALSCTLCLSSIIAICFAADSFRRSTCSFRVSCDAPVPPSAALLRRHLSDRG
jgi:hypothetical protein